ncbi:MAG: hypothetical protein LBV52_00770 [Spirochaetaceae bacterium]|jgi:hypothetical protein|nr:hypothetical protein [Spirochaetaceae bacterium]
MADKLEWMNKHLVAVRYTSVPELVEKEHYKIRPDLESLHKDTEGAEDMVYKFASVERYKCACELLVYMAHKRSAVWWGYRCVMSLMEELVLNPAAERDIATIGASMEPEIPEFAKIKPPEPSPDDIAFFQDQVAQARAEIQKMRQIDPEMLAFVEKAIDVSHQEFKRVHGMTPTEVMNKLLEKAKHDQYPIDPNSPIFTETAKLKAKLASVQKETVETIKAVLPPKVPAHIKKMSDNAMAAVYRWICAPNAENAQCCMDVGNECPDQPAGLLSLSAFWAFGNLMPQGDQTIPTPAGLSANGLVQTLLMCALNPGGVRKVKERYLEYFRLGIEVLTGADNWEASLADGKMPHENIREPDWAKASDKSASEWQSENGFDETPVDDKTAAIAKLCAEQNELNGKADDSPAIKTAVPDPAKQDQSAASAPQRPAYKRWKPEEKG